VVWPDPCVRARTLAADWFAVRGEVAGFAVWSEVLRYASMPSVRPFAQQTALATRFLRLVAASPRP
jgi:uncharacterized heparinase superfamily protein